MFDIIFWGLLALIRTQVFQWLPPRLQQRIAQYKIIREVRQAYNNVPYYRAKYDQAGIDINTIKTLADLKKLPPITKDEIRENFPEGLISNRYRSRKLIKSATTGSTGKAVGFVFSPATYAHYITTSVRVYTMIGYRPWHKVVYIKYTTVQLPALGPFFRTAHIPSTITVEEQISRLRAERPDVLVGYASLILEIARTVTREDLKIIRPRMISVNSELSTADQRDFIARVFGCPVYDEYSTEETWMIASQCSRGRYHIFTDNIWLEFLDRDGNEVAPGETGEIFITTMNSPAMPFIRYRIGDMGRLATRSSCPCGRGFPILEAFDGRADDSFILPSGRYVSSLKILNTFTKYIKKDLHLMEEFKVIQHEQGRIEIMLEPGRDYTAEGFQELVSSLQTLMGEPVDISVSIHDRVDMGSSIKRKAIESRVRA